MADRVVVLRAGQPREFLEEACAALADEVNTMHEWTESDDETLSVYAVAVTALARLRLLELADEPGARAQVAIIEHLIERVRQAQAGEIQFRLADVVDRLHAEALCEAAPI